jgi:tetratricopeptide (TPR) repeat protein
MRPLATYSAWLAFALLGIWLTASGQDQPGKSSIEGSAAQSEAASTGSSGEFDRLAKLANEARESERVDEAITLYQQALRLRPTWDEGWFYLGTLYYSVDRHQEALEAFRRLLARQPKHGPTLAFLGLCEFELRDYERALNDLQTARSLGMGDNRLLISVTQYNLGILLNRFGRHEDAFEVLQQFAREHPEDPSVLQAFGLSVLLMPYLPSEVPSDKYDLALMAGRAAFKTALGQAEEASRLYEQLVSRYPEAPNVHYAYGAFLLNRQPDKALEEFRREMQISPSHLFARLQLALEYVRRGEYKAGLPLARQAVELAPNLFLAREALGRALLETGEVEPAIQQLEAGARLEPDHPQIHFQLARAYRQVGRNDDAARENAEFSRLDSIQRTKRFGPQAIGGSEPERAKPTSR